MKLWVHPRHCLVGRQAGGGKGRFGAAGSLRFRFKGQETRLWVYDMTKGVEWNLARRMLLEFQRPGKDQG